QFSATTTGSATGGLRMSVLDGLVIGSSGAASLDPGVGGIRVTGPGVFSAAGTAINVTSGVINVGTGGSTTISTGVGSVRMSTANPATNTVWIPISYGGTTYYLAGFTTNAP